MRKAQNIVKILRFDKADLEYVGKKAFELGELEYLDIPIPDGFVITTFFFNEFLEKTEIDKDIANVKRIYHPSLKDSVGKLFEPVRKKIIHTHIPHDLAVELHESYRKLVGQFRNTSVNIFSSVKKDEFKVFLDIKGDTNTVLTIKKIWSSHLDCPVAVVVIKNIKSEIKGKVFTDCPTFDKKLTEMQKNKILDYCKIIQKHFYFPKEIEYAIKNDKIFITQVNPFTGRAESLKQSSRSYKTQKIMIKGISINPGIATGKVKIFHGKHNDFEAKKGEIIVLPNLKLSMFKKIKKAKAIIVDSILPNSLDKTLFRKTFHIPTVEGALNAMKIFQNGNIVTVNGVSGEIYSGGLIY